MNNQQDNHISLEAELDEAINEFFETARQHDFAGAERVTYIATTSTTRKSLLGNERVKTREERTSSLAYSLWDKDLLNSEDGMYIAAEGVFIEVPSYPSYQWPKAISRPRATRELIDHIHRVTGRIGS
jgi:hypothetical protein